MKTTLQNFGVPLGDGKRGGILQPLPAWRFRVSPKSVGKDHAHDFMAQVEDVFIDFVARIVKVKVRATVLAETFDAVLHVASLGNAPRVEAMDGGDDVLFTLDFGLTKLTRHDFALSYANPASAVHELEWSFKTVSVITPVKEN
jgi:hypothetical protein